MLHSTFSRSLLSSLFFLHLSLITSCQDDQNPKTSGSPESDVAFMEPALKSYLDSYVLDAAAAGVPIANDKLRQLRQLTWVDRISGAESQDGALLGHCQRRSSSKSLADTISLRVEVRRPNAQNKVGSVLMDDVTLKAIIYHELGHCLHDFSGHLHTESAAIMSANLEIARYLDFSSMLQEHFSMLKQRSLVPAS